MAKGKAKALMNATSALGSFVGEGVANWILEKGIDQVADYVPFISQMLGKDHAEVMEKLENISNKIDEKTTEILGTVQQGFLSGPVARIKTPYDLIIGEMRNNNENLSSLLKRIPSITDKTNHVFGDDNYTTLSNIIDNAYNELYLLLVGNVHNYIDKTINTAKNKYVFDCLKTIDDAMGPYLSALTMAQIVQLVIKSTNSVIAKGAQNIAKIHLDDAEKELANIMEKLDEKVGGLYTLRTLYQLKRNAPIRIYSYHNNNLIVSHANSNLSLAGSDNYSLPNSLWLFWGYKMSAVGANQWVSYNGGENWNLQNKDQRIKIYVKDFVEVTIGGINKIRPLARVLEEFSGKWFDNWEHSGYFRASDGRDFPEHMFYIDVLANETSLNNPWLYCGNCSNLWSPADGTAGCCSANNGGGHNRTAGSSGTYYLPVFNPSDAQQADQSGWHVCKKCRELVYGTGGSCAKGGAHDVDNSKVFSVNRNDRGNAYQSGWYYCSDCQTLHYGTSGVCSKPGGGVHRNPAGTSSNYSIYTRGDQPVDVRVLGSWRWFNGIEFKILSDGTITPIPGREATFELIRSANWAVIDDLVSKIKITWTVKGANIDLDYISEAELTISPDNNTLTGTNVNGTRI